MKAIVLREIGGPEKLQLDTAPDPTPNPGDLASDLIRSQAVKEVGPPLRVLRIDRAQDIFSSPDPEVPRPARYPRVART